MTYNGGLVLPSTTTYAMWWGPLAAFPSDAQQGVDDFLEGLSASLFLDLADEYLFGQKAHTRFAGNLFDSSTPPPQPSDVNGNDLVFAELYNVIIANGLKADPTALYLVYTSNFPAGATYCAFHGYGVAPDGTFVHYVYVPNLTSALAPLNACPTDIDPLFAPNPHSNAVRSMVTATAHEIMESITDPNFDGWYSPTGFEVGDYCAYAYLTWVPVAETRWKIQRIWSNNNSGCVQGAGRSGRVVGAISAFGASTTFDIAAAGLGTFAESVNNFGTAVGTYIDANNDYHGFVRDVRGSITTFDPPGAATSAPLFGGTTPNSVNDAGTAAGWFLDSNLVYHGFLRDHGGNLTIVDAAGAVFGTVLMGINASGKTTGFYLDGNNANRGFVRDSFGNFSFFDAPGAIDGQYGGTTPLSINVYGGVTGQFIDVNAVNHSFVRHADGTLVTFDAPGATQGTYAQSINAFGAIAGYFTDAKFVSHGFIRDVLGNITTFDVPEAVYGTFVYSINALGSVAGYYSDGSGFPHAFVRDRYGSFFTIPASVPNYGNVIKSLNDVGETAGYVTKALN